jgi:hypothetical protein
MLKEKNRRLLGLNVIKNERGLMHQVPFSLMIVHTLKASPSVGYGYKNP